MKTGKISAILIITAVMILSYGAETCFAEESPPRLVAHGGGFVTGYGTTNSYEALMQSIADGYRLIELDFDFSKDGKLIMIHDWDRTAMHYFGFRFADKLTEREFERILVHGRFKTLTLAKLIEILDEYEDIRIVTDIKSDNVLALTAIAETYPGYIDRFIPQIYSYEEYGCVKELGYRDVILTLYAMENIDYEELTDFVKTRRLYAVTVGDEHEYHIEDLKYKLADDGIRVYYHPVSDFETALEVMEKGVYGVYASRIIPADFEEPGRTYYFLDEGVRLGDMKLEDRSFASLKNVMIKNGAGKDRLYLTDCAEVDDELIENLDHGRYELKLILTQDEETVAELEYLLWVDEGLRVLDKRYGYRLDEFRTPGEIREVLEDSEVRDLLLGSLIVKAGEHYGYYAGEPLVFMVNDEILRTGKHTNGSVISPFAECIRAIGAESVYMDESRFVYVHFNGTRFMMQANTAFISRGFGSGRLAAPMRLYRDKTMAQGEIYKFITGREYIDNQEIMILLPAGVKAAEIDDNELFEAAAALFGEV